MSITSIADVVARHVEKGVGAQRAVDQIVARAQRSRVNPNLRRPDRSRSYVNGDDTHARIVARCRELMVSGRFRPLQRELTIGGGFSLKSLRYHYKRLDDLYEEALDDATRVGILARLMPNGPWPAAEDCARIVRAVVIGRLVTGGDATRQVTP